MEPFLASTLTQKSLLAFQRHVCFKNNFTAYQAGLYTLRAELLVCVHKDQGGSLWLCFPPSTRRHLLLVVL